MLPNASRLAGVAMIAARKAPRHNPTGSASARLSVGPWCAALNRLLRKAQFVETEDYVRERGVQLIPGRFKEEIGCAGRIVAKDPNRSRSSKCHSRLLDQISSLSSTFQSGPEQPLLDQAKVHFRNSEYGLAERYFRQAVAERYRNVEAWLGLAASYDNLKVFSKGRSGIHQQR
jgi:hypothetical protein